MLSRRHFTPINSFTTYGSFLSGASLSEPSTAAATSDPFGLPRQALTKLSSNTIPYIMHSVRSSFHSSHKVPLGYDVTRGFSPLLMTSLAVSNFQHLP